MLRLHSENNLTLEYSVNFTREPIIETVIMPREGSKLLVRNSKGGGQEEYYVDSIEVISFGASFFFRSQERPKSFLVPVTDYEVLEQKEVRVPLKNAAPERSIKIGGGREGPVRRESAVEPEPYESQQELNRSEPAAMDQGRKRDKRRRGRRGSTRQEYASPEPRIGEMAALSGDSSGQTEGKSSSRSELGGDEPKVAPSFISKLFPPPTTLIKETLSRYKPVNPEGTIPVLDKEQILDDAFIESFQPKEKKGRSVKEVPPSEPPAN